MKIKKLNGRTIEVNRISPYTLNLSSKAYDFASECDPCDVYEDEDGLYYIRGPWDQDGMTEDALNRGFEELADDVAASEAEWDQADTGMTFQSWKALILDAEEIDAPDQLLAEIGGPTWIDAYKPARLRRICEAAEAVAHDGVKGLMRVTSLAQRELAQGYGFGQSTVEGWCASPTAKNHRDLAENVLMLLSYAVLKDHGIL